MSTTADSKDNDAIKKTLKKSPNTIMLFSYNDQYRCYGNDAQIIANDVMLSDVGLRLMLREDSKEIYYLNLSSNQFGRVVRDLLLLLRYRVEVYEDTPYRLKAKGVLGNLTDFEDIVSEYVELSELSTVMCVRIIGDDISEENHICAAFCNSQEMRVIVSDLNDTPNFTLLENCIISIQPHECILLKDDSNLSPERFKKLESSLKRTNLTAKILDSLPCADDKCGKLQKMFNKKCTAISLSDTMWEAIYMLFVQMHLFDTQYERIFSLMPYNSVGYMYLGNAVIQALEIFGVSSDEDSAARCGNTTLYDHMNKCRTNLGKLRLREWLKKPLFNLRQIEERLNCVETFVNLPQARQYLHDNFLRAVPDISHLVRKFVQNRAALSDCYRVYQFLLSLKKLETFFETLKNQIPEHNWASIREMIVEPVSHSILEFERFASLVQSTIDEQYYEDFRAFRIKPDIDNNLLEMDLEMKKSGARAKKEQDKLIAKINCENVKLESNGDIGYFFRVTLKAERFIRNDTSLKIIDATKGGGVRFYTQNLANLNEEFRELQAGYEKIQSDLADKVVKTCSGYVPALQSISETIGILDVLVAFGVVSSSAKEYSRPKILEKGTNVFELRGCRHPVIENLHEIEYIANDCTMGTNFSNNRFILLTGANMGGKSTYLRSAALTVLMAQMGSFVPCSAATFSLIDGIYTRVGASDFQYKGVSTFMAEMVDCSTILERATENSLILIDELGRGTSTYDGFGLAWAISEDIILRIKCFCLFATHFHELSKLSLIYPQIVKNSKMDTLVSEEEKLIILYQVVDGVSSRSFGLEIAKIVGFPDEIIKDAKEILNQLERTTSPDFMTEKKNLLQKIRSQGLQNLRVNIVDDLKYC